MLEYIKEVFYLFNEKLNRPFLNSDSAHAKIVLPLLFLGAKTELRILARSLSNDVADSEGYIEAISHFIEQENSKLTIILTDYTGINNGPLFQKLSSYKKQGKDITILESTSKILGGNNNEINFTIGDNNSYRIEFDTENRKAICNFNDSSRAESYINYFDRITGAPSTNSITF